MLMLGGKQPKTGFPRRLRCMINTLHKGKTLKDLYLQDFRFNLRFANKHYISILKRINLQLNKRKFFDTFSHCSGLRVAVVDK